MKGHNNRINRIEYIVRGNPEGARQTLYDAGFEVPENETDLVEAMKEWVALEGKKAVKQLLNIHPERNAILAASPDTREDSFCGCEHAFNGHGGGGSACNCGGACGGHGNGAFHSFSAAGTYAAPDSEAEHSTQDALKTKHAELLRLAALNPQDEHLGLELEKIKAALLPKKQDSKTKDKQPTDNEEYLIRLTKKDIGFGVVVLGLAFLVSRI